MVSSITPLYAEISKQLSFDQPYLQVCMEKDTLVVTGTYHLKPKADDLSSNGSIDSFEIRLVIPHSFPQKAPKLFEIGERIPKSEKYHINPDGSCCYGVWEASRVQKNTTFRYLFDELIYNFFFGQVYLENHGRWPFGEYKHGYDGIVESFSEILQCQSNSRVVCHLVHFYSKKWPLGHWRRQCPCKKPQTIRKCACCKHKINAIKPWQAKIMLKTLKRV